jgi:mRNA-degrading endonuclease toxin of MazEF toxin-antitoxin module
VQRLSQGQVIELEITDPNGQNSKRRPVVILTETDELAGADEFVVAAISTKFVEPLPADCIELPCSNDGHAKSGLTKPSVVKCRWLRRVKREAIRSTRGHLPSTLMCKIMRVVRQD